MTASVSQVISTKVENHIFKHNCILDTCVLINNPHWQSIVISVFLRKYYIVISDTLEGAFLGVFFLLLAVILSELREKPKRKDWVTEKSTQKNLCEGYHFFWPHALLSMSFCCFLRVLHPPSQVTYLQNDPYKDKYFAMGSILCDNITSKRLKIWKSPTI